MNFNKDDIKNSLTIEQIYQLLIDLGGEPQLSKNDIIISKTICHCGHSHKLYYYDNTKLFKCWTECNEAFDIFDLIAKNQNSLGNLKVTSENGNKVLKEWTLIDSVVYLSKYFNFSISVQEEENGFIEKIDDWTILNRYKKSQELPKKAKIDFNFFDNQILKNFPTPLIIPWAEEGISKEVMNECGIAYDPIQHAVIIPHYNIDNKLIGIRERTLIKENEKYGKYKPAIIHQKMYNHPLGFSLYHLNQTKNNIRQLRKGIIYESEKSCLLHRTYFGAEADISCACCGSSLLKPQVDLLLSLGVEEIIIGYDKQFQELGDKEWESWTQKLTQINDKYSKYVKISFLFDKENLLDYKDSPIDKGKNIFLNLFENRIFL